MSEEIKKVGRLYRENLVRQVKEGVQSRSNTFLVTYSSLSSSQMNSFRKDLKQLGARLFVSKNRIAKLAFKDLKQEKLGDKISGQTALVWGDADSAEISKALVKFSKECEGFVIQGGLLDGALLEQDEIKRLSDLPSREALLAQLLQVIQSPITGVMNALNGKTRELIYLLKQFSEKKGGK